LTIAQASAGTPSAWITESGNPVVIRNLDVETPRQLGRGADAVDVELEHHVDDREVRTMLPGEVDRAPCTPGHADDVITTLHEQHPEPLRSEKIVLHNEDGGRLHRQTLLGYGQSSAQN
jgi:hypothetical protein